MCGFAYLVSLMVYQLGGLILGQVSFGLGTVAAIAALAFLLYMIFRPYRESSAELRSRARVSVSR